MTFATSNFKDGFCILAETEPVADPLPMGAMRYRGPSSKAFQLNQIFYFVGFRMSKKITLSTLAKEIGKANSSDDLEKLKQLEECFRPSEKKRSLPFAASIEFNPSMVEVDQISQESDAALAFANAWARSLRHAQYRLDKFAGVRRPVVVSEGDSWFQYPIRLNDVVDSLINDRGYQLLSLGAAGDLLGNMVQREEYVEKIEDENADVFLVSGGGNDMLGGGRLRDFVLSKPANASVQERINGVRWRQFLEQLTQLYEGMFDKLTSSYPSLKIICHGYDYALPRGQQWLGEPLESRRVPERQSNDLVKILIDGFNERLIETADRYSQVTHVDCRGVVGENVQSWYDELHPNNAGYKRVADRFHEAIQNALSDGTESPGFAELKVGGVSEGGEGTVRPSLAGKILNRHRQEISRPSLAQAVSKDFSSGNFGFTEAVISDQMGSMQQRLEAIDLPELEDRAIQALADDTSEIDGEKVDTGTEPDVVSKAIQLHQGMKSIISDQDVPGWCEPMGAGDESMDDQEIDDQELLKRPPCESLKTWQAHIRRDPENLRAYEEFRKLKEEFDKEEDADLVALRQQLLPIATLAPQERVIGESDLFQINFLGRGVRAARSVGRISVFNEYGTPLGSGTGFMVAPNLLLTNNHVLSEVGDAKHSHVLFEYEYDEDNRLKVTERFKINGDVFCTSKSHDFTFVSVDSVGSQGSSIDHYGALPLIEDPGKALKGESVSIIQHADGLPKQIAIRNSRVVGRGRQFIYYITDTEPGSSGSPVVNDQWIPVALHHRSVPHYFKTCEYVANRGIRISSIFKQLKQMRSSGRREAAVVLERLANRNTAPGSVAPRAEDFASIHLTERNVEPYHEVPYDDRKGYDPDFLGIRVNLPLVIDPDKIVAPLLGSPADYELKYEHFSIVMNRHRRMALFTAANVDLSYEKRRPESRPSSDYTRDGLGGLGRNDREKWFLDPRIAPEHQIPDVFYNRDRKAFHKGHLVRRVAVAWGDSYRQVRRGNGDTFHVTNCSPQVGSFNVANRRSSRDGLWGDLEKVVERNARTEKLCVFCGPLFSDQDRDFQGRDSGGDTVVPIPSVFWKLIVARSGSELQAFAYWLQQDLTGVEFDEFTPSNEWRTHQISVAQLESKIGTFTFPDEIHDADTK